MTRACTLKICLSGVEQLTESVATIIEALDNAHHFDGVCISRCEDGIMFNETVFARLSSVRLEGGTAFMRVMPTPGVTLVVAYVLKLLGGRATVEWRGGWPFITSRPCDEGDEEEPVEPLRPVNLVPVL